MKDRPLSVFKRAVERTILGVSTKAKQSKITLVGHVMRVNDNRWTRAVSDWIPRDVKRTVGKPTTRWSEFFTKSLEERYDARRVPKASRTHWATLPRDREKWRI
uniref:Endonuclease-reverse transcriptase n=1 Tax=Angiostrongylus cantonensis TaxID=6313 RepID=A0A0K0CXV2_ANGCA